MKINRKNINWESIVAIATILLFIATTITAFLSYKMSKEANDLSNSLLEKTSPNQPEIKISIGLSESRFINEGNLHHLQRVSNGTNYFLYRQFESFDTYLTNIGKGIIPWASIDLKDSKGQLELDHKYRYYAEEDITPFESRKNEWRFYHKNCTLIETNDDQFRNEQEKNCEEINISSGISEWVLRVRCPVCINPEKYYIFYLCTINEIGKNYERENCTKDFPGWENFLQEITPQDKKFKIYQRLF